MGSYIKHGRSCLTRTLRVENRTLSGEFLTNVEVFGIAHRYPKLDTREAQFIC